MSQQYYTQLSYEERVLIEDWNKNTDPNKPSLRKFAEHLSRSPATISRELNRNGRPPATSKTRVNKPHCDGRQSRGRVSNQTNIDALQRYWKRRAKFLSESRRHYTCLTAQRLSIERAKHIGLKLEQSENEELLQFVITALDSRWSPEQISGRIKQEGLLPSISCQAIYNFIYQHEEELHLKSCLRRRGKTYRKQKAVTYNTTSSRRSIDERPAEVSTLERIGDLEGDTIVGKDKTDRLLTHVERKSGLLSIGLIHGFDANLISKQTLLDIRRVFAKCHTITYDNGAEFSFWYKTEKKLDANIYFAHAYHSWERGRNENTNGLIRDFLPKGTDFKNLTINDILAIESLLNNRPRKRLKWLTPAEYYASYVNNASVALGG